MKSKSHPREKNKSLGRTFILNPDEILLAMTQVITFFCARFDKNVILDHIFFFSFSFSS
jgi:hypothetical protein